MLIGDRSMSTDRRNLVRRLSRDDAAAEAIKIARDFIAESGNDNSELVATHAAPCSIDPRPVGKTPTQWSVGTDFPIRDDRDVVMDGAPMIIVDLLAGTAGWGLT